MSEDLSFLAIGFMIGVCLHWLLFRMELSNCRIAKRRAVERVVDMDRLLEELALYDRIAQRLSDH